MNERILCCSSSFRYTLADHPVAFIQEVMRSPASVIFFLIFIYVKTTHKMFSEIKFRGSIETSSIHLRIFIIFLTQWRSEECFDSGKELLVLFSIFVIGRFMYVIRKDSQHVQCVNFNPVWMLIACRTVRRLLNIERVEPKVSVIKTIVSFHHWWSYTVLLYHWRCKWLEWETADQCWTGCGPALWLCHHQWTIQLLGNRRGRVQWPCGLACSAVITLLGSVVGPRFVQQALCSVSGFTLENNEQVG